MPVRPADRPDDLDAVGPQRPCHQLAGGVVADAADEARLGAERRRPGGDVRRLAARRGDRGRRPVVAGSERPVDAHDHVEQQVAERRHAHEYDRRMDATGRRSQAALVRHRRRDRRCRRDRHRAARSRRSRRRAAAGGLAAFEDAPCFLETMSEEGAEVSGARRRVGAFAPGPQLGEHGHRDDDRDDQDELEPYDLRPPSARVPERQQNREEGGLDEDRPSVRRRPQLRDRRQLQRRAGDAARPEQHDRGQGEGSRACGRASRLVDPREDEDEAEQHAHPGGGRCEMEEVGRDRRASGAGSGRARARRASAQRAGRATLRPRPRGARAWPVRAPQPRRRRARRRAPPRPRARSGFPAPRCARSRCRPRTPRAARRRRSGRRAARAPGRRSRVPPAQRARSRPRRAVRGNTASGARGRST